MNKLIEIVNVNKVFRQGETSLQVLKDISIAVSRAEFLGIYGPSGAGKSTLLHIMGLLDIPTSGEVVIEGRNTSKLSDRARSMMRNKKIGFIFQMYHLLPEFDLYQNILLPARVNSVSIAKKTYVADKLLVDLRLSHRKTHDVRKLSGGEMQRACIIRAMVNDPLVLLCDEPTGNLDATNAMEVWKMLKQLNKSRGKTIVVVTHDERALPFCTRVVKIENGVLTE